MPDLAVIIVTWNVRRLAVDALRSLQGDLTTSGLETQLWVVDNASTDGSNEVAAARLPLELVRKVTLQVDRSEYKRKQGPPGLKLTSKAFSVGRRFPLAQKFSV